MTSSVTFNGVFRNKRVLVTGHTGFKGSWLCQWLISLGAEVTGYALSPEDPALFTKLQLSQRMRHVVGDIRDCEALRICVAEVQPAFVFHLAAQALVRLSYENPVETYDTNVMGTVNVLEALRTLRAACVAVIVTSDKCYENREWVHSYREEDALGGYDPYSSSKAAAEIVTAAYRRSYFPDSAQRIRVLSVRAGNVIGGGDWAADRIIPDCMRALACDEPITVRNPHATRPWQHVLEPLSGYLWLAATQWRDFPEVHGPIGLPWKLDLKAEGAAAHGAFNFGPYMFSNRSVGNLVIEVLRHWPGRWENPANVEAKHEATLLNLSIDKAFHLLRWRPIWDFETTVATTVKWYRQNMIGKVSALELCEREIAEYTASARVLGLPWAGIVA